MKMFERKQRFPLKFIDRTKGGVFRIGCVNCGSDYYFEFTGGGLEYYYSRFGNLIFCVEHTWRLMPEAKKEIEFLLKRGFIRYFDITFEKKCPYCGGEIFREESSDMQEVYELKIVK